MADEGRNEVTALGDSWRRFSDEQCAKGNVDVYPGQFTLRCGKIEIISTDGSCRGTRIFIDGKLARGVYDLHIHFNSKRLPQLSLSVFMGEFQFDLVPREKDNRPKEDNDGRK